MTESLLDTLGRPLGSLRLSVTDRCNLRCAYCMPEADYAWLPRQSLLSFEELTRLARLFSALGAHKVRLTGGEPLIRRDLPELVRMLAGEPDVRDLALTTNGLLLTRQLDALAGAGLQRVTISLDTLRPERFLALARSTRHADVLDAVAAVQGSGLGLKLNTVVMRGINDDELGALIRFAGQHAAEIRFIEYMDVGGATGWSARDVVSRAEILQRIGGEFGSIEEIPSQGSRAPADRFRLAGGQVFGIIASTTSPFCRTCDRSRITADGTWFLCLYAAEGLDLRAPLRDGATDAELRHLIARHWTERADRGAEERLAGPHRSPLYQMQMLRADPHREMHTRGG